MTDKLDPRSADIVSDRIDDLLELFPEARSEGGRVDFDRLRAVLGEDVNDGRERFGMSWPGKAESIRAAQKQSVATLLPVESESVDFESTENVIIEGDNLEVLKLLQKSYLGKIKMIYIDPPYNTGNDFIYPDNYSESLQTYLEYTGQVDEQGKRFSTNTETDGRFHSKWMSMMYPRLMLARNLLTDDGVIFISIDDSEVSNLLAICHEVFGERNFIGNIIRATNSTKSVSNYLSINYDYTLVYARSRQRLDELVGDYGKWQVDKNNIAEYRAAIKKLVDRGLSADEIAVELKELTNYPRFVDFVNYWYSDSRGVYRKGDLGGVQNGNAEPLMNPLTGKRDPVPPGGFRFKPERLQQLVQDDRIHFHTDGSLPTLKRYLDENLKQRPKGIMSDDQRPDGNLLSRFGIPFPNPKQLAFMQRLISIFSADSVVLDFFAGSGTTGHAVLAQNAKDGGSRRFILVQLPEPVEEGSEAAKAGFGTIADITKERVRRAAQEIAKNADGSLTLAEGSGEQDLGFRVFKLGASNFQVWDAAAPAGDEDKLLQQLELQVEHVEKGRSGSDVVFEVLLKSKLPLTSAVERVAVGGGEVWSVEAGRLLVVVDRGLDLAGVRELAKRDPKPESVVILDRCFGGDDSLKANARKIFQDADIDFKTI